MDCGLIMMNEVISMKKTILDYIEEKSKIVIFGAGKYAEFLFKAICYSRTDVLVRAFCVSNVEREEVFFGKPIISFENIDKLDYDVLVVALGEKNRKEVVSLIEDMLEKTVVYMSGDDYEIFRYYFWQTQALSRAKLDYKRIVFDCFHGAGYRDNVKYVAEELHKRMPDVAIFWYIEDEGEEFPEYVKSFTFGNIDYYGILYTSGIIITNNGTNFANYKKKDGQYLINTWHGIDGIKKIGLDVDYIKNNKDEREFYANEFGKIDLMVAGSQFNHYLYRHSLCFANEIVDWGYPRNDIIMNGNPEIKNNVRKILEVGKDDVLVLYAPTYRHELEKSESENDIKLVYDIDLKKIRKALEDKYNKRIIIVYRLHHILYRNPAVNALFPDFVDVTHYPDMQELLLAADILLTDYSSCMWDFSLMLKPVFLYIKDIEKYDKSPGFYHSPLEYPFSHGMNSDELCEVIKAFDEKRYIYELTEYHAKMERYDDGHASEKLVNRIIEVIKDPSKYVKSNMSDGLKE